MLREIVDTYVNTNSLPSPYEGKVFLYYNMIESDRFFFIGQLRAWPCKAVKGSHT